jgi:hypothetical protein
MLQLNLDLGVLDKELRRLGSKAELRKAVNVGLARVALELKRDSIKGVPRDKGDLLNSYKVEKKGDYLLAGYNIIYAMYQHQGRRSDGSYIIQNRPAGGRTYFLKLAIDENFKKYIDLFEITVFKQLFK